MTTNPTATEHLAVDLRLLGPALGAWLATLAVLHLGLRTGIALSVVATVGAAACRSLRWRAVVAAVLVVVAGFALAAAWRVHAIDSHPLAAVPEGASVVAIIDVVDDPRRLQSRGGGRVRPGTRPSHPARSRDRRSAHRGRWQCHRARTRRGMGRSASEPTCFPPRGRRTGTAPRPDCRGADRTWPPHFSRVALVDAARRGAVRDRFAGAVGRTLPADEAALLPGLVVGDTSRVSPQIRADFRAAGLAHLLAVSGANVSILLGAVLIAARGATLGPRISVVIAAVVLAAFVVLARPSPSVLRAAVMGAIGLLAMVTSRRKQAMPAWGSQCWCCSRSGPLSRSTRGSLCRWSPPRA